MKGAMHAQFQKVVRDMVALTKKLHRDTPKGIFRRVQHASSFVSSIMNSMKVAHEQNLLSIFLSNCVVPFAPHSLRPCERVAHFVLYLVSNSKDDHA